ncbi:hypothetical protein JAAARDRAFT_78084 [Jaapia argillacea MUCL 33604]|uniref:Uncharacterized protein n=1 Tax=Jaapia argillacea MUCL 33604 TaxID=933084 RepID=A0A067PX65_9AGAM|nr:hypothetical protein JAAARDRAFT_78084 [Jaapia argillacea MUCL 33604]
MVRESCYEGTRGRDIPDIVDGGSNVPPPEVRVLDGSAIRSSSVATAEPSDTVPVDSNSLVTPNITLDANPPTSADSPPQMSSDADPIPVPSPTLESFQRFRADCFKFSTEKPPVENYSAEGKQQFVAMMLLEWERLRVNAEVFNPDQTVQVEFTSIKDKLDMFEQRLARSQKTKSSALHPLYDRLILLEQRTIWKAKPATQLLQVDYGHQGRRGLESVTELEGDEKWVNLNERDVVSKERKRKGD